MFSETGASGSNRPYPPASNVATVLQRVRSRNLPERIDLDYLVDAGISESLVQRVAFALRFLKLVESDSPTQALRAISTSTDEEYRDILGGLLRDSYSDVFAVIDPAEDDQDRILNVFRRYTPASQRARMVSFFLGMCREAGIPTLDAPRQRSMSDAGRTSRGQTGRAGPSKPKPSTRKRPSDQERQETGGGLDTETTGGIPSHLALLIQSLPQAGKPLSVARRKQWLAMAESVLAFTYPEEEEVVLGEEEVEEGVMSP